MTQSRIVAALGIIAIVLLALFIAGNTYWEDIPIPTPPKGEAITNPFYAAQRFAEELGATTRRDRSLMVPSPQSVIVLSVWHWDLSPQRQAALRRWVESGGRLVVDRAIVGRPERVQVVVGTGMGLQRRSRRRVLRGTRRR